MNVGPPLMSKVGDEVTSKVLQLLVILCSCFVHDDKSATLHDQLTTNTIASLF